MTDDPTPAEQNITEAGKTANRAAYARLAPALKAWRASIGQRVTQMQGCKHTYAKSGSIFVCQKCGQSAPIEEAEIEYW